MSELSIDRILYCMQHTISTNKDWFMIYWCLLLTVSGQHKITAAAPLNISTPCQDCSNTGPGLNQPTLFSFRKHVFDSRKMVAIISNFTLIFIIFIKTRFRVHCITTRTGHISSDKKSNKVVSVYFICFWKVLWTARIFIYWTFKTILDRHIQRNRVVFINIF